MIFASKPANFFRAFMDHKAHDATAIVCLPQEIRPNGILWQLKFENGYNHGYKAHKLGYKT